MNIASEIHKSVEVLKNGGLLLYPAETLWGIGCDATNEDALQHLIKLKNRPESKGFICLIDSENKLQKYVKDIPEIAYDIIDASTEAITIVYPQGLNIAPSAIYPDGSIAIRIVKTGFAHEVIRKLNRPIISTSANLSGDPFPLKMEDVSTSILGGVDYVVNLEAQLINKPSSILKLGLKGEIKIIRH